MIHVADPVLALAVEPSALGKRVPGTVEFQNIAKKVLTAVMNELIFSRAYLEVLSVNCDAHFTGMIFSNGLKSKFVDIGQVGRGLVYEQSSRSNLLSISGNAQISFPRKTGRCLLYRRK